MKNPQYDLEELTKLMVMRNNDPQGFNCEKKDHTFFISAMVEELGEMAGAIKKLERGFNIREKNKLVKKLKDIWEEKYPGQSENYSQATDAELELMWVKTKLKDYLTESSDLFLYMILLNERVQRSQGLHITDFFTLVQEKFNKVSKELNPNTTYLI